MKIRDLTIVLSALLIVSFFAGCGGAIQKVILPANVSPDIAVLSLGADTSSLNQDQIDLLQRSLGWMYRDIISSLTRKESGSSSSSSAPSGGCRSGAWDTGSATGCFRARPRTCR